MRACSSSARRGWQRSKNEARCRGRILRRPQIVLKGAPTIERQPWRIPADGGTPRRLVGLNGAVGGSPSIHPDGQQVAFAMDERNDVEVWVLENFLPTLTAKK